MTLPRGLRVEFAGAVYQVMARGNERRKSVRDDRDRDRFLETLREMAERFGLRGVGVLPDAQSTILPALGYVDPIHDDSNNS